MKTHEEGGGIRFQSRSSDGRLRSDASAAPARLDQTTLDLYGHLMPDAHGRKSESSIAHHLSYATSYVCMHMGMGARRYP
jgi:hypothetical protein